MEDFPYLEWLTSYYLKKAELNGDWRSYLQAHGLANYSLVVDAREERRTLVYEIERSWYKGKHPLTFSQHQNLTSEHKQLLEAYRKETQKNFDILKSSAKDLDERKLVNEQNVTNIKSFSSKVFEASKACSEGLANVSKHLISSSVDILKQVVGEPPCAFAVLGLGSIAKGEATPYSDLEYAFLVDEGHDYFISLAMDSYFRLGNLGESPLKTFDIEELKSPEERLPLATEHLMKAGLRIDGITKNSGNIPTGNGKENGHSLTLTVDQLMKLYKTSAESKFDGFAGDKSDMLSSTVVIYANEETTSRLYSEFEQARIAYEGEAQVLRAVCKKRLESFKEDLKTYTFLPEFVEFKPPANLSVKVKADIFRCPTLLANNIKMCLGVGSRYSWQVFDWLKSKDMLSEENHLCIQTVLALSIYMRTSSYLHQRCQTDTVRINPYDTEYTSHFYSIDLNLFVILGRLLIPLKQHFASHDSTLTVSECNTSSPAKKPRTQLDRWESSVLQPVIRDFLASLQINANDDLLMAEVLHFAGRYSEAKKLIRSMVGGSLDFKDVEKFLQERHTDSQKREKYIELVGYLLYNTGDYSTAIEYLQHLSNRQTRKRFWTLLIAVCKQKAGDYITAGRLLHEVNTEVVQDRTNSMEMINLFYGADVKLQEGNRDSKTLNVAVNHPDVATSYSNVGNAYHSLGEYQPALEYYNKSLEIQKTVYGAESSHADIATSCNDIGKARYGVGDYTSALEYHNKSLKINKDLYGAEANHPDIATTYSNIGHAYYGLGECTSAFEYYNKSLGMRKHIFGDNANHPDIAVSYNDVGDAYHGLGKYKLALDYHTKSLAMRKAVYGDVANHPYIATSYNNIGNAHHGLGVYTLALECYNKSLEMEKAIYGAAANHPNIAASYSHIGSAYESQAKYTSALEYYTKALKMKKAVYGAEASHPNIATSFSNIGDVYHNLGKYASALEYYNKSLEMEKTVYGVEANHPHIAASYSNIGKAYEGLEKHKSALEYYNKSLEMEKTIYGTGANKHPDVASSYSNIGDVYHNLGKYTSALKSYTKSLTIEKAAYGPEADHPSIAASYSNIGSAYEGLEKYRRALEYYNKSLEMEKVVYGTEANHPRIATSYSNIADAYESLKEYTSALEYYMKSLEMEKAVYGTDVNHPDIANTHHSIGQLYIKLRQSSLSRTHLTISLEMYLSLYGPDYPEVKEVESLLHSLAEANT